MSTDDERARFWKAVEYNSARIGAVEEFNKNLPAVISEAVTAGITKAAQSPQAQEAFWASAFDQISNRFNLNAGGWLLGGVKASIKRLLVFAVLALLVYQVGGLHGVAVLWKTMTAP